MKGTFFEELQAVIDTIRPQDKMIIMGERPQYEKLI